MDSCEFIFYASQSENSIVFFLDSISGSSATIYAYLGEFHTSKHRSSALLYAMVVFGTSLIALPGIAWVVMSIEWEFNIPIIDIVYKPWRLFMIICSVPGLLCSLGLVFLPESPKYTLGQGDQAGTIQILETINRCNNGGKKAMPLNIHEILEEFETIENRKRVTANKEKRFALLKSIWNQTAPLFQHSNLRATLLACIIQFGIFASSQGMVMWFPEILNRVVTSNQIYPGQKRLLCSIVESMASNITSPDTAVEEMVFAHDNSKAALD